MGADLSEPCPILNDLAAHCVRELDNFRASPSAEELARRRKAGWSAAQDMLLLRWGYPYVMEEFRFHMTLTAGVDGEESVGVGAELARLTKPYCQNPLPVEAVGLFCQDRTEGRFRLLRRYTLHR